MQAHNCQCTQCRKQTGSLLTYWHTVPGSALKWTSKSTFGDYSHTPGIHRFFCQKCGGTLAWQNEKDGGPLEFTVGTVDEECLIGKEKTDDDEEAVEAYGYTLADPHGTQYWSEKAVKGVTDNLPGPKHESH